MEIVTYHGGCVLRVFLGETKAYEGLLRHFAGDHFEVYSAGLEPKGISPYAIQAMQEIGIDISGHRSKSVMDYLGRVHMDTVITICSRAEERCPIFPFTTQRLYWPFEGPAAFVGTPDETLASDFFGSLYRKS